MMRDKDGNLINIPADELAKISLGLSKLRNQFDTPPFKRKTAPELLRDLLAKKSSPFDDSATNILKELREQQLDKLVKGYKSEIEREPCEKCGRCVCDKCVSFMTEHNVECDECNTFTAKQETTNTATQDTTHDDVWNTARDYYKKVHEKSVAKMLADQEYARKIGEKFENERLQEKTLREYDNAISAMQEAKEKHESATRYAAVLAQLIREAEMKKIKAHDEYEWICNNAPKR